MCYGKKQGNKVIHLYEQGGQLVLQKASFLSNISMVRLGSLYTYSMCVEQQQQSQATLKQYLCPVEKVLVKLLKFAIILQTVLSGESQQTKGSQDKICKTENLLRVPATVKLGLRLDIKWGTIMIMFRNRVTIGSVQLTFNLVNLHNLVDFGSHGLFVLSESFANVYMLFAFLIECVVFSMI